MISLRSEYKDIPSIKADALVFFIPSDEKILKAMLTNFQSLFGSAFTSSIMKDISGDAGETRILYLSNSRGTNRIIIVGIGESKNISLEQIRRSAANAAKAAQNLNLESCAYILDTFTNGIVPLKSSLEEISAAVVEGITLAIYRFDRYRTDTKKNKKMLKTALLIASTKGELREMQKGVQRAAVVADAVYLARDLGNTPGGDLYPETLAEIARKRCIKVGCKITTLDEKKVKALKMGGILSVSKGSSRPPRFIIIEWNGGKRSEKPYIIIGKGITFDTGGISLKPSANMGEMKMDMSGAAATIGTLYAAAKLKLPLNIIGLIPACENMPSGTAYRPGDIIKIMDGKSVEVDNTDAEGRLILADALVYAKRYKPKAVIDLATLTGACVVALGHHATGMMGNDESLMNQLKTAGNYTYERVWELPLFDEYEKQIKSDVADIKNVGGRWAGAITAGWFLKKFVDGYSWVHLDIAGTAILEENSEYTQKGASGVGVRLLIRWLENLKLIHNRNKKTAD